MRLPERPPYISEKYSYQNLLDELISINKFNDLFQINDDSYPYWEKWKYLAKEWNFDSKKLWAVIKTYRLSRRKINFLPAQGFAFYLNTPAVVQQYLHEFDLNLGGTLQSESIIPADEKERYLISSLMEEAIASSQLEGAATTRRIAKEMLESNRKPRNTSEQMIANNYDAMKWIVGNKNLKFTPEHIQYIHTLITKETLSGKGEEGAFRKDDEVRVVDVQTGNTIYKPPPYEQVDELIDAFCLFANDEDKSPFFIHPIVKGIFLHFLIGYIHPFSDGNGRTARTIFYWYLLKKGYWLIEYMSVSRVILGSKAQYARAYLYTEMDENDLTYFVLYSLKAIHTALDDLKKHIQKKIAEKKNVLALLRNTSFNDRQVAVLQDVMQDAGVYFTVQQIQTRFGVSNQTARNDLTGLVNSGLLEYRKSGKKIQFFPVENFMTYLRSS
jgi:Fic family protein